MGVHNLYCPTTAAGVTPGAPLAVTLIVRTIFWLGE
jgi:hypothetical protein